MSYSTEIAKSSVKSHIMAVMTLRYKILDFGGWTSLGGNKYSYPYNYGYVSQVVDSANSTILYTAKESVAELSGNRQYFYDEENELFYLYSTSSPNSSGVARYIDFEYYLSTLDTLWYRTPTDSATVLRKWVSNFINPPEVNTLVGEQQFSIFNVDATGFEFVFEKEKIQVLIDDKNVSFKNAPVDIYHVVGALKIANIQKIFRGAIDGDVETDLRTVRVDMKQDVVDFDAILETRTLAVQTDSESFDPANDGQPLRLILGSFGSGTTGNDSTQILGLKLVNQDYNGDAPTTSNNRVHVLAYDPTNAATVSKTFTATAGASTSKKILSNDEENELSVNQKVRVHNIGAGTDFNVYITDINSGTGEVTFSAAVGTGSVTIQFYCVKDLYYVRNNVRYEFYPVRDFSVSLSSNKILVTLTSSAEANAGGATFNPQNGDYLLAVGQMWYDKPTISGNPFPADVDALYFDGRAISTLYWYLTAVMGFAEADIDTASFLAASDGSDSSMRFWYPQIFGDSMPSHQDIILNLLNSAQAALYVKNDSTIAVKTLGGTGTAVRTLTDAEIFKNSMRFKYEYADLIRGVYPRLACDMALITPEFEAALSRSNVSFGQLENYTTVSEEGGDKILHRLPVVQTESPTVLSVTYRSLRLTLKTSVAVSEDEIGDTITISSKYLPGFEFDDTAHDKDFLIVGIKKSADGVELVLDDTLKYT